MILDKDLSANSASYDLKMVVRRSDGNFEITGFGLFTLSSKHLLACAFRRIRKTHTRRCQGDSTKQITNTGQAKTGADGSPMQLRRGELDSALGVNAGCGLCASYRPNNKNAPHTKTGRPPAYAIAERAELIQLIHTRPAGCAWMPFLPRVRTIAPAGLFPLFILI